MESLTSTGGGQSPTILSTGNGNDSLGGGGALGLLGLAALFGGRGFGNNGNNICEPPASFAFAQRAADNSSLLLAALGKSEGDIKESTNAGIHRLQIENSNHFNNLNNRLCDAEKESIKSGYEARLESLQTKADLLANQNSNTISIKDDIKEFRFSVDKEFCRLNNDLDKRFHHIEHFVDKKFDRIFENELKQENRRLQEKLDSFRYIDERKDITEIKRDVDRIICGLSKVPSPTGQVSNILDGCGC